MTALTLESQRPHFSAASMSQCAIDRLGIQITSLVPETSHVEMLSAKDCIEVEDIITLRTLRKSGRLWHQYLWKNATLCPQSR
jgi:hypothetical protein